MRRSEVSKGLSTQTSMLALSLLCLSAIPRLANASPAVPSTVVHAIYLQTQGVMAETNTFGEPCTIDGINDAAAREKNASENQDVLSLSTQQSGYAASFARCALQATDTQTFALMATGVIQSGAGALAGHWGENVITDNDRAKAQQYAVIAHWLLASSATTPDEKSIAATTLELLRKWKLVSQSQYASPPAPSRPSATLPTQPVVTGATPIEVLRKVYSRYPSARLEYMEQAGNVIAAAVVVGESGSSAILRRGSDGLWHWVIGGGGLISAERALTYGLSPQEVANLTDRDHGIYPGLPNVKRTIPLKTLINEQTAITLSKGR